MIETAQPAGASLPGPITAVQGAQMLAEKRAASQATNPSEAARILGQRAAEARAQARQAAAEAKAQEASADEADAELQAEDKADSAPDAEAASESPSQEQDATQDDPGAAEEADDAGTIDLGDGVKLTKQEIRDGILMRAQFTKNSMELSEAKKAFESDRTQRLTHLDTLIGAAQASLGQPKSMKQWLAEDPVDGMMKFAEQQERFEQFGHLIEARQREQAHHVSQLKQATIQGLSTKHGVNAEGVFSKAVQYVASKTGTDQRAVEAMLAHPEAVELVNDAIAYRELKSKEPDLKRTIADKPKVVKPGAKVSAQSQNQSAVQNARATLQKSGSLKDAVAFLQAQRKARG